MHGADLMHGASPAAGGVPHLYVHVPFCAHRCGYCDFVTVSHQPELHARYVDAVIAEFELRAVEVGGPVATFETIFIGGGTPTLLEHDQLRRLLRWCAQRAAPDCELTIECNPETVSEELAALLVREGVTRVSLGAQSLQPHLLEVLERRATPQVVREAIAALRAAGIANLNLDLLWAVPGQSDADLRSDLEALLELGPDHISAYELDFKPGTRLTHAFGSADTAVGAAADNHYDLVVDMLTGGGFDWYETANFARPGKQCKHNLGYWLQRDYMGIGIGAVGTIAGDRRVNLPNLPRYLASIEQGLLPPARLEMIDAETRSDERLMLGLRLQGPFQLDAADNAPTIDRNAVARLAHAGLLTQRATEFELTRQGRMMLNTVITELTA